MQIHIDSTYDYTMELLRRVPGAASATAASTATAPAADLAGGSDGGRSKYQPVHIEGIEADLGELVDETYVSGVLADKLPRECDELRVRVRPEFKVEPLVDRVVVELDAGTGEAPFARRFSTGRWARRSQELVHQFRQDGRLDQDETALSVVYGRATGEGPRSAPRLPPLQAPVIDEASLEECGVRALVPGPEAGPSPGSGSAQGGGFDPMRPVLVSERLVEDVLDFTERAGTTETGGAVLGRIVRLPEPLPGAATPVVTLLTTALTDPRHVGQVGAFAFSPAALAEAYEIADLRGRHEQVLTAFHTHGWGSHCGNCNESETCALPMCTEVSLDDYQVLESMLPGKATLMPIAGRKLGAPGRRPVLEIHSWNGGKMLPIAWQRYAE